MKVINSLKSRMVRLPVYGGSADVFRGALMMPGVSAETDDGVLIKNTATSNADAIGVLQETHDYSETGDALVDGSACWYAPLSSDPTDYPSRMVELIDGATLVRVDQDISGDSEAAVASYSAPTVTITSLEDNIDTGFLYVASGTGVGQLEFIDTSSSGSCTVESNFSTALDNTSGVAKILPLFHQVVFWTVPDASSETKIGSKAAAGTGRVLILERRIIRNGLEEFLDPHTHGGLTGLNDLSEFKLYSILQITNAALHPID